MAHQLNYKEWADAIGRWHCNDISDLAGQSGFWWIPSYLLNMSASEYVQWLINNYHPDYISYNIETNFLSYSWSKEHYSLCHKFVLYINAQARKKNFIV